MTEPGTPSDVPDADRAEQEALLDPPGVASAADAAAPDVDVPEADALEQQLAARPGEAGRPLQPGRATARRTRPTSWSRRPTCPWTTTRPGLTGRVLDAGAGDVRPSVEAWPLGSRFAGCRRQRHDRSRSRFARRPMPWAASAARRRAASLDVGRHASTTGWPVAVIALGIVRGGRRTAAVTSCSDRRCSCLGVAAASRPVGRHIAGSAVPSARREPVAADVRGARGRPDRDGLLPPPRRRWLAREVPPRRGTAFDDAAVLPSRAAVDWAATLLDVQR